MSRQADQDVNHVLRAWFDDVVSQDQRLRPGLDEIQERLSTPAVTVTKSYRA